MLLLGLIQAIDLIETMAMNTYQWPNERNQPRKGARIFKVDEATAIKSELATVFLQKFFPPSKTSQLKIKIAQFKQFDLENLYQTWERFKELLKRCPQHGFTDRDKVQIFYNGLNGPTRTNHDAAVGGEILLLDLIQATDLIETMAVNTYQWPNKRNQPKKQQKFLKRMKLPQ